MKYVKNFNKSGSSYGLSSVSLDFIKFCDQNKTVFDIGCGCCQKDCGGASLLALRAKAQVIACDIEKMHVTLLEQKARQLQLIENLQIICGSFPNEINSIPDESLDAIHVSSLFDLMSVDDLLASITKIYKLLKPGGRLFSTEWTIYNKTIAKYIPIYESRRKNHDAWPGLIEDISLYCDYCDNLPRTINHLNIDIISNLLKNNGFYIENIGYLSNDKAIPFHMRLDGREWVGTIARK